MHKQIGYIGLGKMGRSMVLCLLQRGWRVVSYNRDGDKTKEMARGGSGSSVWLCGARFSTVFSAHCMGDGVTSSGGCGTCGARASFGKRRFGY